MRAGMVIDPAHYRWSSYRHYVLGQMDQRLNCHPLYLALGREEDARRAAYGDSFRGELDDAALTDIRMALMQGQAVGSQRFKEEMNAAAGVRRAQVRRGRPARLTDKSAVEEQTDFES